MTVYVRPSKTFVFRTLAHTLRTLTGAVGVDAGAASLKNRSMFHTQAYYGIDIDYDSPKGLLAGFAKGVPESTYGIHADISRLDALPSNSADVVVSTNTLYVLSPAEQKAGIEHLVRITRGDGVLICELPLDEVFDKRLEIIQREFVHVRIVYYKNFISRFYESVFEDKRNGFLGSHPVAGSKPFLVVSWLLSWFEYPFSSIRTLNTHALVIARKKHNDASFASFDLSHIPLTKEGIYDLHPKSFTETSA